MSAAKLWLVAASALSLAAFYLVGFAFFDGFTLDLGSLVVLTPRYLNFVPMWVLFGGLSSVFLTLALARRAASRDQVDALDRLMARLADMPGRYFVVGSCAVAMVVPLILRTCVLRGAPLTDDEGAYRFAADLLASGRLWAASPPLKLFFDQNFFINDGRLYPAYFLGWPVLLCAGIWLHVPAIVNPLLSALTVPPLAKLLTRLAGPNWVRPGVLLFLSSPFIQVTAATWLSQTACLMALTWSLWFYFRTTDDDASWRQHSAFAFFAALAFCIRPQATVPLGLPLIVSWSVGVLRKTGASRARALVAFLVPATIMAALFLGALRAQNGSAWITGYSRYGHYLIENDFRFTTFRLQDLTTIPGLDFPEISMVVIRTVSGVLRLNSDLFGWPCSLVLLAVARSAVRGESRILWWMLAINMVALTFQHDWGVDTFGPVHALEMALPIVLLTVVGARNLGHRLAAATLKPAARDQGTDHARIGLCLVVSSIVVACLGFTPVRLRAVHQIAEHVNVAWQAPERAGLHHAVIFAPFPVAPPCGGTPSHFVFFRPPNDPDLRNDVLWVNTLDDARNRQLVNSMSGRAGYVLRWTPDCEVSLQPVAAAGGT